MPYQASRPHPSSRNPVVYERIRCLNRFVARFSSSDHSVNSSVCYCVCHNSFDNKVNFTPRPVMYYMYMYTHMYITSSERFLFM